ncbi:MAG: hypothetical protein ACKO34_08880 [Vampirovibrionales bacterium]
MNPLPYLPSLLFPKRTWFWWGVLWVCLPLGLLAFKQLLLPFMNHVDTVINGAGLGVPLYHSVKFLCFSAIALPTFAWCCLQLTYHYHAHWATFFDRPHPLHCDFHPHPDYSYWALLRWYGFRTLRLLLPFTGGCLVLALLLGLEGWLFNLGFDSPLLRLPLPFIVGLSLLAFVGFFLLILGFVTLYQVLTSCYGTPAAVCEPLKAPSLIMERSKRIALLTPWFWIYLLGSGVWWVVVLSLSSWMLVTYQLIHVLNASFPFGLCLLAELFLSLVVVGLGFVRFFAYHQSLVFYYDKLPTMIKQTYAPPPSFQKV